MIDIGEVSITDTKVTKKDLNKGKKQLEMTGDIFAR